MIQTIFIDIDDTLLDFAASENAAIRMIVEKYDLPEEACHLYRRINADYWRLYEKGEISKTTLFLRRFEDLFSRYDCLADRATVNAQYLQALGTVAVPMPGAEAMLQALWGKYTLCVATNGTQAAQESRMGKCGFDRYFDHVFISDVIGIQKPEPGFFEAAFATLGNPPRETMLILGDSLTGDMAGGRRAGITTCWFNPKGGVPTDDCDYTIPHLSLFPDIVSSSQ